MTKEIEDKEDIASGILHGVSDGFRRKRIKEKEIKLSGR